MLKNGGNPRKFTPKTGCCTAGPISLIGFDNVKEQPTTMANRLPVGQRKSAPARTFAQIADMVVSLANKDSGGAP